MTIAAQYIGGRLASIPEDQFFADGIRAEVVEDDGTWVTYEFVDGSRGRINSDGEIFDHES